MGTLARSPQVYIKVVMETTHAFDGSNSKPSSCQVMQLDSNTKVNLSKPLPGSLACLQHSVVKIAINLTRQ